MPEPTKPTTFMERIGVAARFVASGVVPQGWFSPGTPLAPQAPEEVRGRTYDFPTGVNWNFQPRAREILGFPGLKTLATNLPQLRLVIERQKDLIEALEWQIKPRLVDGKSKGETQLDDEAKAIAGFLAMPDKEHDWAQWLRAIVEQQLVIDAVTIYARPTRGGDLFSLDVLDGATITPIVDGLGRRPMAPEPAYQQILHNMPAIQYTSEELLYYPQNFRADKIYGYSRVEHVVDTIRMFIARGKHQMGWYTHGNLSDGFFEAPDGWTPDQIRQFEDRFNALMQASIEGRRMVPWVPHGTKFNETKVDLFDDKFEEWLMRLICFGFGVDPKPFLKQMGLGNSSAEADQDAAEAAGLKPLMQYVVRLMNRILAQWFNRPDLEFAWVEDREFDPKTASEIDDRKLKNGTRTINQIRDRDGEPPIPGGDKAYIFLPSGPIAVEDLEEIAARNAEPPPPPMLPGELDADGNPVPPSNKIGEPQKTGAAGKPTANETNKPGEEKPKPAKVEEPLAKAATLTQRRRATSEKRLALVVGSFLKSQAKTIADTVSEKLGLEKAEGYEKAIEAALDDVDWVWSELVAKVDKILAGIAVPVGMDAVSELGLFDKDTLAAVTARATEWATDRAAMLVGMKWVDGVLTVNPSAKWSIADTTRSILRTVIAEQMDAGASTADMRDAIMGSTAFDRDRAETIARTEAANADVQGNIAGWKASGVVAGKKWIAAPDCCDECQDLDGEIVDLDDEFTEGDPPLHPNCRCDVSPVLPEDMPGDDAQSDEE